MILNFIAALVLGLAIAGVVMLAFRLTGRKAPRWLLPAAAGLSMIAFQIWSGYTWFSRTAGALPPHIAVAGTFTATSPIEPWTFLMPRIERFSAVDLNSLRSNPRAPSLAMAEIYLVGRYAPTAATLQVFDCETGRRADVVDSLAFDDSGQPTNAQWVPLRRDDPMRRIVCARRAELS